MSPKSQVHQGGPPGCISTVVFTISTVSGLIGLPIYVQTAGKKLEKSGGLVGRSRWFQTHDLGRRFLPCFDALVNQWLLRLTDIDWLQKLKLARNARYISN